MQKNTNEKSKIENESAKTNTAISPIVSVVKNEIHPPSSVGGAVLGAPKNADTQSAPHRESVGYAVLGVPKNASAQSAQPCASVEDGLAPPESSSIVSTVTNEIHPPKLNRESVGYAVLGVPKNASETPTPRSESAGRADTQRLSAGERGSNSASSSIITDPNGSYTGTPLNPNEQPVQDVDDL